MIRFKVHDILQANEPFSEYLMTRDDSEKPIEPLVISYWYVVTEVNLQKMYIKLDSYYLTAEYYIFADHRGLKHSIKFLIDRIASPTSTLTLHPS